MTGLTVHFLVPIESHGEGFEGDRFFVPADRSNMVDIVNSFEVDEEFEIEYNKYGKVSHISAID